MSELQEFIKKRTLNFKGISSRKLYGLEAFYLSDKPFIVITATDQVAIKVDDFETKKELKNHQVTEWTLDNKIMENWFLLPRKFNNKKNKLIPILEMTSKVLLQPKKQKTKKNKKKKTDTSASNDTLKNAVEKPSFLRRLINKIK